VEYIGNDDHQEVLSLADGYRRASQMSMESIERRFSLGRLVESATKDLKGVSWGSKLLTQKKKFVAGERVEVERVLSRYLKDVFEQFYGSNANFEPKQLFDCSAITNQIVFDENEHLLALEINLPTEDQAYHEAKTMTYKYNSDLQCVEADIDSFKLPTNKEFDSFYNQLLHQCVALTIYATNKVAPQKVQTIVINGITSVKNKATGNHETRTILSIQVKRDDLKRVNFAEIDAEKFFKHFHGVSAGSLVELEPVTPLIQIDSKDKRIIKADAVIDSLGESRNLAAMPWEEFEVLVRDLMAREFSSDGSKVHVTQASRDNGVDAIAFDPDPIRGGKFVIQAKRYNILVPVSAVRDLYGTVVHEGARSGIIITTSHYGPEAREFAKDKPITLINGNQLLGMFEKHGYKFSIKLDKRNNKRKAKHG